MAYKFEKPKAVHAIPGFGKVEEYQLPKNQFGFTLTYRAPEHVVGSMVDILGDVVPFEDERFMRHARDLSGDIGFRNAGASIPTAHALEYLALINAQVGQFVGICPQQHVEQINRHIHGRSGHYQSPPGHEIFRHADTESNFVGVPFLRRFSIGPRHVVFANTYMFRPVKTEEEKARRRERLGY